MAIKTIYSNSPRLPMLTRQMFDDFLAGKFRLYWHKELILKPLTTKERSAFDEAVSNGFLPRKNAKSTRNVSGAYYYWCEVNCRPNIEIRQKTKYSGVRVDFITIVGSEGYSKQASAKIEDLIAFHLIHKKLKPGSCLGIGGIYSVIYIKNHLAPELARTLWEIALEDMRDQYGDINDPELADRIFQAHMRKRWGESTAIDEAGAV